MDMIELKNHKFIEITKQLNKTKLLWLIFPIERTVILLAMVLMWLGCSSMLGSCLPNYTQYHIPK
jgi:hypothetical protein